MWEFIFETGIPSSQFRARPVSRPPSCTNKGVSIVKIGVVKLRLPEKFL